MGDSMLTIDAFVRRNEHPVNISIVDRFKSMNLEQSPHQNPEIMMWTHGDTGHGDFEMLATGTASFIKTPQTLSMAQMAVEPAVGDNRDNSNPDIVGVPGEKEKDSDPPLYERYEVMEEKKDALKFYNVTVPSLTTVGIAAAAVYFLMCSPKRRTY